MSLVSLFQRLESTGPADEKILSDGTEVAGTVRLHLATYATLGKLSTFLFQHCSGSASMAHSARYNLNSSSSVCSGEKFMKLSHGLLQGDV